jgi:hypothetical protein
MGTKISNCNLFTKLKKLHIGEKNYMYHFKSEKHCIVKVNGIFTESILDCDGSYRNNFQCIFRK